MNLNKKGFTLVELLAVIAVLGIIIGIATMNVISAINKSKSETQKEMIGNLKEAAVSYAVDHNYKITKSSTDDCFKNSDTCVISVDTLKNNGYFEDNKGYCKGSISVQRTDDDYIATVDNDICNN
ncbi:MAG: type II secretion system protein [Firmicutes bacterium]|nr:type II secretion system protein [Bacillota bacterium]